HAGHKGVQLADGKWLSERLLGVQVLLLAGCQGDRIGDWLGVVPFVITIDAAIGHDDAAVLCEHFWIGIRPGSGAERCAGCRITTFKIAMQLIKLNRTCPLLSTYSCVWQNIYNH
ncbi:MAG: hypothetical protein ACKO9F_05240, partial [Caldilinea sp.]